MRKSKKEIKNRDIIVDLLKTCDVGRLGTVGADGYPMVKPLNFAYHSGSIFFHTALEGEKMEHIRRDDRVCFEVDLPMAYVRGADNPCSAEYLYRSVIIRGRARIIEDRDEKMFGLRRLMEKYQPAGGYGEFREDKLQITGVVRIDIEEISGKEDMGKGGIGERLREAIQDKETLPVVIDPEAAG
jgi:nitroimidazol reductase NimA-like FMN-containing flavoprotein (pyridoxamine 5'-phosphate oxidase superfamily)